MSEDGMPMPTRARADAEQELVRAIGAEVGKHIHERVTASFEQRLRELDRVVGKATSQRMKAEENLRRAQATRDRSQAHLQNAVRQIRHLQVSHGAMCDCDGSGGDANDVTTD